jgi:serine/threonine protein phosphatase PrpC
MGNLCQGKGKGAHGELTEESSDGVSLGQIQLDGPLTQAEVNERIVQSDKPQTEVKMKTVTLNYAFVSQRGFYPDDLTKANQDSFCVTPNFNGEDDSSFFGVFDGHGSKGHLCAQFARDSVQANLVARLNKGQDFSTAYPQSSVDANNNLHASRIDDSMSGTTYIGVMVRNGVLEVANCGDSRAIIAQEDNSAKAKKGKGKKLIAIPLSIDQTPFRKDERERVKLSGARVMTMDQLDGLEPMHENWGLNLGEEIDDSGDPPRIWAQDGDYPGTAFTRSIGDAVSERLGVFAEPEMHSQVLSQDDRFLVIASDGVFEFLTSQAVVDMVVKFDNPLAACRAVVAESYQLWLQYEVRTDDITIIIVNFSDLSSVDDARTRTSSAGRSLGGDNVQMRPVRSSASKAKKKAVLKCTADDEDEEYVVSEHLVPKTADELKRIDKAVRSNFLFQHITPQQREDVFSVMHKVTVDSGEWVIRQGRRAQLQRRRSLRRAGPHVLQGPRRERDRDVAGRPLGPRPPRLPLHPDAHRVAGAEAHAAQGGGAGGAHQRADGAPGGGAQ